MLIYDLQAKSSRALANLVASYIRRGFEVMQIVTNKESDKNTYTAFMVNKRFLKNVQDTLGFTESEMSVMTMDLSDCKIDDKFQGLLEAKLFGNTEFLFDIGYKVFFENVVVTKDNGYISSIIISKPKNYDKKSKSIKLSDKDYKNLKDEICKYFKDK